MTNAPQCREQARRVYYGCVFKAKKETPDKGYQSRDGHFEDVVRTEVLPLGLVDIKVCLKLVIRKSER